MSDFYCIGRDGIRRTFKYTVTRDLVRGEYTFRVVSDPPPPGGEFFELSVCEIDQNTVRVEMANHFNRPEYVAMGIPESLLPIVRQKLGMRVESSPKCGAANVYRTNAATKYWERLCVLGGATYDPVRDVYSVV